MIKLEKYKDEDFSILTRQQRRVFELTMKGKTRAEIAIELGCGKQNISVIKKSIVRRFENPEVKPKEKKSKCKINYDSYRGKDLSALTHREREALSLKLSGLDHQQIADELGLRVSTIYTLLPRACKKLDGQYDNERKKINEQVKEWRRNNSEKTKEYRNKTYLKNREKYIANMREYNKEYYQRNKDKILARQKERIAKSQKKPQPVVSGKCNPEDVVELYKNGETIDFIRKLLGISHVKVRKILITEGLWSNDLSVKLKTLLKEGKSKDEICSTLGISKETFNNYIPYEKGVYGWDLTDNAIAIREYRKRKDT